MVLTGREQEELARALRQAFPDRESLQRLTSYRLDQSLDEIAATGDLQSTVFNLIRWAEAQGRIRELITAARDYNPGNEDLNATAARLLATLDRQRSNAEPALGTYERQPTRAFTIANTSKLFASILGPRVPSPVFLIGGGASQKSGIPLSDQLVERAARLAYCQQTGRHEGDPNVKRSDWIQLLRGQSWYDLERDPALQYHEVMERLLQPIQVRREFFRQELRAHIAPSLGYERLVTMMADGIGRIVLTTNADDTLPTLCRARPRPHYVEVIGSPADYHLLSSSPAHPQIVYLHGSLEHYVTRSPLDIAERLDEELVRHLLILLRDHPLVVLGYRGAESSIMRHLLCEQSGSTYGYPHGIYWCELEGRVPVGLHPLVAELRDTIGPNLQVVPIAGFDELMEDLWSAYEQSPHRAIRDIATLPPSAVPRADMQAVTDRTLYDLDWPRVQMCLADYCRRLNISVPTPTDEKWQLERMRDLDIAVQVDGTLYPTAAGYLLFARNASDRFCGAQVVLRVDGELDRTIQSNLWTQLEVVTAALSEVNLPFRLKGTISETVFPYPPLAIKELLVNALVHRSYEDNRQVLIEIAPGSIRIQNPGGLVEEVQEELQQAGIRIQERIERGERGLKGYRNPVIADLFYGAGAMDKEGSGLSDVQSLVARNNGKVVFGPTQDNSAFDVILYNRPEAIDAVTGTAVPLTVSDQYTSNLLEFVQLPSVVWHGATTARYARDVWRSTGADWLPAFVLHEDGLFCFPDLNHYENPLRTVVDGGTVESFALSEFLDDEDKERHLVQLLNFALYRHFEAHGLVVDRYRKRAYFPRTEDGGREVSYQASLRRAKRTVTKPVISKSTGDVRYWEHQGIRFGVERYGDAWALQVLPCYVFTLDGERRLLEGPRVGPLATKRAARDYNPQVRNSMVFWAWVLSGGGESIEVNLGCGAFLHLRAKHAVCEVRDAPLPVEEIEDPPVALEDLEEELGRLAELEMLSDAANADPAGENGAEDEPDD